MIARSLAIATASGIRTASSWWRCLPSSLEPLGAGRGVFGVHAGHGGVNRWRRAVRRFRPLRVMAVRRRGDGAQRCSPTASSPRPPLYLGFACSRDRGGGGRWIPALVHVQRDYPDRLGLSIGIVSAGVGVGMVPRAARAASDRCVAMADGVSGMGVVGGGVDRVP